MLNEKEGLRRRQASRTSVKLARTVDQRRGYLQRLRMLIRCGLRRRIYGTRYRRRLLSLFLECGFESLRGHNIPKDRFVLSLRLILGLLWG